MYILVYESFLNVCEPVSMRLEKIRVNQKKMEKLVHSVLIYN